MTGFHTTVIPSYYGKNVTADDHIIYMQLCKNHVDGDAISNAIHICVELSGILFSYVFIIKILTTLLSVMGDR